MSHTKRFLVPATLLLLVLLLSLLVQPGSPARVQAVEADQMAGFPVSLNSAKVQYGSPTLADLTGDGMLEIVVGTSNGIVWAIQANGRVLWRYNMSDALNAAASRVPDTRTATAPTPIRSTPAVADLNGDGSPEVVVAAGDLLTHPSHGGVVVLNAQGALMPGWPQLPRDSRFPPDHVGYLDGVASSPAVGDIDGDGSPEIVYGSFDQYVYAHNLDGSPVPGWPFWALDTVWSSPALADIDGNGVLDVVIGVDAHFFRGDTRQSDDGGYVYALRGDGTEIWPQPWYQDEIVASSPAVADIDSDNLPEIVFASGNLYGNDSNQIGRYVTALNHDGTQLWKTTTPVRMSSSPALGDIDGEGRLEVVLGGPDGKVYAFDGGSGNLQWASTLVTRFGTTNRLLSPVLGDYDGDGLQDVFINIDSEVGVLRGTDGVQITSTEHNPPDKLSFYAGFSLPNTPVLGDLNGDGTLELVAAGGSRPDQGAQAAINVWSLPGSTANPGWPQFSLNSANTGSLMQVPVPPPPADLSPEAYLPLVHKTRVLTPNPYPAP